MIIETIVTTMAADGAVNCAPMGVEWDPRRGRRDRPRSRSSRPPPTATSSATRAAVVNLIDDVRVFARAAISNPAYDDRAGAGRSAASSSPMPARGASSRCSRSTARRRARASRRGRCTAASRREFIGFNRARHAVLEAAIYATRVHLLRARLPRQRARAAAGHRRQDRGPARARGDGPADGLHPPAPSSAGSGRDATQRAAPTDASRRSRSLRRGAGAPALRRARSARRARPLVRRHRRRGTGADAAACRRRGP